MLKQTMFSYLPGIFCLLALVANYVEADPSLALTPSFFLFCGGRVCQNRDPVSYVTAPSYSSYAYSPSYYQNNYRSSYQPFNQQPYYSGYGSGYGYGNRGYGNGYGSGYGRGNYGSGYGNYGNQNIFYGQRSFGFHRVRGRGPVY